MPEPASNSAEKPGLMERMGLSEIPAKIGNFGGEADGKAVLVAIALIVVAVLLVHFNVINLHNIGITTAPMVLAGCVLVGGAGMVLILAIAKRNEKVKKLIEKMMGSSLMDVIWTTVKTALLFYAAGAVLQAAAPIVNPYTAGWYNYGLILSAWAFTELMTGAETWVTGQPDFIHSHAPSKPRIHNGIGDKDRGIELNRQIDRAQASH